MSKARILVVDDNEQNRHLLTAQLEHDGYEVSAASSGVEAIGAIASSPPDLVILDVMMPEMDGFEVCRRIRAMPEGNRVPVIFLTALGARAIYEQAIASGGDDFLGKPADRTELLLRARSLIRIARLQAALVKERDALVRLQTQKDALARFIVHDLKNPLASILANGEFLASVLADEPLEATMDVMASAETLHQMVLNLLDVSRAEEGMLAPVLTTVDVRNLVEQLRQRMIRRMAHRSQRLEIDAVERIVLEADESLLLRTLANLVDNAVRYTPPGGTVWIRASVDGDALDLIVADEGRGVDPEHRERIFEKYWQVESAEVDRTTRGLGLPFCRLAMRAHGGDVMVEDNEPQGARFRIRVPIRRPESSLPTACRSP